VEEVERMVLKKDFIIDEEVCHEKGEDNRGKNKRGI